ncbi:saccharopine dehydrogenase NADP-binding domain-containing protein [Saccharomonospora sp. NPDC046836]|uniref:saccharopine dehydrogenase family protein n=1 Tax=Saccharomonospora sp. NPDC046836 TaxID=3156921 RepID=UPI0033DA8CE0
MTLSVVVVGGAGVMGSRAVQALVAEGHTVTVADLQDSKVSGARNLRVDVTDESSLAAALTGHDVVVNFAGPYYLFGARVARAAFAASLPYIDVCDDAEAAEAMIALDYQAKANGVTAITGAGCSPGVANGFATLLAQRFSVIEGIDICWVQGDRRPGGRAPLEHFFYGIDRDIPVWTDGQRETIRPFQSSSQRIFPFQEPLGPYPVLDVGHPETVTLPRVLNVGTVRNKGSLVPAGSTAIFQMLRGVGLLSDTEVTVHGQKIDARTFVAQFLTDRHNAAVARNPQPSQLGIGVEVRGRIGATEASALISMANQDPMNDTTAIPLVAALGQLASGDLPHGVHGPEVLDTARWFSEIARLDPTSYGGIEVELPSLSRQSSTLAGLADLIGADQGEA